MTAHESPHFRIGDGRKSHREVCISDGDREIPAWQIITASAQGEAANRGAERFRPDGDKRWWYRWTETWRGNRLLSIGTVQPGLASLAGLEEQSEPRPETNERQSDISHIHLADQRSVMDSEPRPPDSFEATVSNPSVADPIIKETPRSTAARQPMDSNIAVLSRIQADSWSQRQKLPSHLRIALFQWEVDDSFRHPLFEVCLRDDLPIIHAIAAARQKGKHGDWTPDRANQQYDRSELGMRSCAEHRRQALLAAALRACRDLKVDVLLLPEYSVRPETVDWLFDVVRKKAPDTWVWAGTYRQPPFLRRFNYEADWSALLSVVRKVFDRDGSTRWTVSRRKKKYPAMALGEQFAPLTGAIEPIVESSFDLRSKLLELICSEVFIVTSPSNFMASASAHRSLLRQFGVHDHIPPIGKIEQEVLDDIGCVGDLTSISANPLKRRSILLVPAMTSRTVDYTVLGQASYLAAGLTTVFCNAAKSNGGGHGQSCFIGHDGWDKDDNAPMGLPGFGPYHGVLPGIYCPFRPDRGWLGTKEQALVIADIDPFYSMEGRPRPQMLPPPLQHVAHLPIIESWDYAGAPEVNQGGCRCLTAILQNSKVDKFAAQLLDAIRGRAHRSTADDAEPGHLATILKTLCSLAHQQENEWLDLRRSAYLSEHAANPQPWPPPVAIDWLYVDLGDPTIVKFPRIEVPPYTRASGGG